MYLKVCTKFHSISSMLWCCLSFSFDLQNILIYGGVFLLPGENSLNIIIYMFYDQFSLGHPFIIFWFSGSFKLSGRNESKICKCTEYLHGLPCLVGLSLQYLWYFESIELTIVLVILTLVDQSPCSISVCIFCIVISNIVMLEYISKI